MHDHDVSKSLPYELTLRRYQFGIDHSKGVFTELKPVEYIALHMVKKTVSEYATEDDKIYLQDLADKLGITIHQASKMARSLKDRGLISWSHDGDGSQGTYIRETNLGVEAMKRQDNILAKRYQRVIDKFGKDNLVRLLEEMKQLDEIVDQSLAMSEEELDGSTE